MSDEILKGIGFIGSQQKTDGSFVGLSSPTLRSFRSSKRYRSVFQTATILSCLNGIGLEEARVIKEKAAKFLLSQKSKQWTFNYWVRGSRNDRRTPYPDDLDDTFCALSALWGFEESLFGGEVLARVVEVLTSLEEGEGGPYRTWVVGSDAPEVWRDVDLAVNANVGYFLKLVGIETDSLNNLAREAIEKNNFFSPYYPSFHAVVYFVARFYGGGRGRLKRYVLSSCGVGGRWKNPLCTAMMTTALLNLESKPSEVEKSIEYLKRAQETVGSWKVGGFCVDPAWGGRRHYAGSAALTTAFCVESLARYNSLARKTSFKGKKPARTSSELGEVSEAVVARAQERFEGLEGDLKRIAAQTLKKTVRGDKDRQIVLMPYLFAQCLGKKGRNIDRKFLENLGVANLYGWMAYTIYDDFLDDEGDGRLLSLANLCLRELTGIFLLCMPEKVGFGKFFSRVMDKLDAANTWELCNCRLGEKEIWSSVKYKLPSFGNLNMLAERSLGHALGPVAVLFGLGYTGNSRVVVELMEFFVDFLVARQLNDDAHDWQEDLQRGQINAVGAMVLGKFRSQKKIMRNMGREEFYFEMQKLFWLEVVGDVNQEILTRTKRAQKLLNSIEVIEDPGIMNSLLVRIENSAQVTKSERAKMLSFLEAYNG